MVSPTPREAGYLRGHRFRNHKHFAGALAKFVAEPAEDVERPDRPARYGSATTYYRSEVRASGTTGTRQ